MCVTQCVYMMRLGFTYQNIITSNAYSRVIESYFNKHKIYSKQMALLTRFTIIASTG